MAENDITIDITCEFPDLVATEILNNHTHNYVWFVKISDWRNTPDEFFTVVTIEGMHKPTQSKTVHITYKLITEYIKISRGVNLIESLNKQIKALLGIY